MLVCTVLLHASAQSTTTTTNSEANVESLTALLAVRRNVLLGEVHDNAAQHALRLRALQQRVAAGERPALAFEQFDRNQQADIDRVRAEQPGSAAAIVALGAPGWNWSFYAPFVQLAVDYKLPIVATNLSRADAMRVSTSGWDAVFDAAERERIGLDRLSPQVLARHEHAVAQGHCDLLPPEAVAALTRAQIARDIMMAQAIEPYLASGVVLLAGNGHVRRDIGVPIWLAPGERAAVESIGLLENSGDTATEDPAGRYDAVLFTSPAERPDPCESLRRRMPARP
ncbi:MAG TPA: ChaN family lipoprotein [Burkholderiaceae bacterium]|nr:ChaN family lipoprotein [Burkholderiaceae bacterium]